MEDESVRQRMLESGMTTLHRRGYNATDIHEITSDAGVAQDCFDNHFQSKEVFGAAVLRLYHERTLVIMDSTLGDETRTPVQRLLAYFDVITEILASFEWRYGCMVSNLSLETAEYSEILRSGLDGVFRSLTDRLAETIYQAQLSGQVRRDIGAEDLADVLVAGWNGAMLRMKVERSPESINRFKRIVVGALLTGAGGSMQKISSNAE